MTLTGGCGLALAFSFTAVTVRSAQRRDVESVFSRRAGPERAIAFLARSAPAGSRLFNAFDDGPWLMWLGRRDITAFIDPRNQLGAEHVNRYTAMLARPALFDATVHRLSINLALVPHNVSWTETFVRHFSTTDDWRMVYWDGEYSLFGRDTAHNAALLERHQYRVLRPTLDLRYLDRRALASESLRRDLSQLGQQSRLLADVIRAYAALRLAAAPSALTQRAVATIADAWSQLPETDGLERSLSDLPIVRIANRRRLAADP